MSGIIFQEGVTSFWILLIHTIFKAFSMIVKLHIFNWPFLLSPMIVLLLIFKGLLSQMNLKVNLFVPCIAWGHSKQKRYISVLTALMF